MDFLNNFFLGLTVALQPSNLFLCFVGVLIGTAIGVLPGIGPLATMSILFPLTYGISAEAAVIMLAGIYYGAQYGGSTTSILVSIPGEASTVVSCIEGYQMTLRGRAGVALGIAAFSSFIAGTFGVFLLQVLSPPLINFALKFGPPEFTGLMILGIVLLTYLSRKSLVKGLLMASVGILLGTVGLDSFTSGPRFTFGSPNLLEGIGIGELAMGLFGISEILMNVEQDFKANTSLAGKVKGLLPTLTDWSRSIWSIVRGAFIGFFLGILPGGSAILGSFVSYAVEKRLSKHPEQFGCGAIEGLAGPESANNAAPSRGFYPPPYHGPTQWPGNCPPSGALMVHGVAVGPMLMHEHPKIFWGVVTSMYIGNAMLLVLNLPLIAIWVKLLRIPYNILFPIILLLCLIGGYAIDNNTFSIGVMLLFGVFGYFLRKLDYEPAPMVLAFVLSSSLEKAIRQSLLISGGGFTIFLNRPIAIGCLLLSVGLLGLSLMPSIVNRKKAVMEQGEDFH